ncbi:hypothetical protein CTheo_6618 [Ceratobasidium theobromae]|uniref:Uncharacterized protein n=1 Tax=Ceratobasidium theobromae TaxID=1582974 RepID=A0A5N5QDW2_9AGAM|nr:hypothetical protein CTheo_6618 [Ceratobasidium theobromae]
MTTQGFLPPADNAEIGCPLLHSESGEYVPPRKVLGIQTEHTEESANSFIMRSELDINKYVSSDGMLYFRLGNFLTPDNLVHGPVYSAFLAAKDQIDRCFAAHQSEFGECEVVVILRCLSKSPKFYYYIVDLVRRGVVDAHTHINYGIYEGALGVEYWNHIALFSAHRQCTPADLEDARKLLSGLMLDHSLAAVDNVSRRIKPMYEMLQQFDPNKIDTHATTSIAKIMRYCFGISSANGRIVETPLSSGSLLGLLPGVAHQDEEETNSQRPVIYGHSGDED